MLSLPIHCLRNEIFNHCSYTWPKSADFLTILDVPYISRGCWQDEYAQRALTDIDQDVVSLKKGHYKRREHPEQNCMEAAKARGFKVFALQDGGQCFGSADLNAYKRYGGSTQCSDGTGGPFANSVYEIREGKALVMFYKTNK